MNKPPGTVQAAPPGFSGFDTAQQIMSDTEANTLLFMGYAFAIRYVSRQATEQSGDLTNAEALRLLNAGFYIMPVQHVEAEGWVPSAAKGTEYGTNASTNVANVGFPSNVSVWLDLEGVASGTPHQTVIDYCNNWWVAVVDGGYTPGLYVGANCGLTAAELDNLDFTNFWHSNSSSAPTPPTYGVQMVQSAQISVPSVRPGFAIDPDTTQTDNQGGNVFWLSP